MSIRFKNKSDIFNIVVTAVAAALSVGIMLYGVWHFGLQSTWPELIMNMLYIACLVMMWMFFFNGPITTRQFNYWCTLCLGIAVLLRDILFPPQLPDMPLLQKACQILSVALLIMLTYFYARKNWESYTKGKLWAIFVVDMLIAIIYNVYIVLEPTDEFTSFMMVEIWIRPTITYGLVACFVKDTKE